MNIIYAMSKSQKDVAADIEQGTRQLIRHLTKLWFMPDAQEVPHWRKEVAEKLCSVDSFKGSHKYPSAEFILDHSWRLHRSRLDYFVKTTMLGFGQHCKLSDSPELLTQIDKYFDWIAHVLSKYRDVTYELIYKKLAELGF